MPKTGHVEGSRELSSQLWRRTGVCGSSEASPLMPLPPADGLGRRVARWVEGVWTSGRVARRTRCLFQSVALPVDPKSVDCPKSASRKDVHCSLIVNNVRSRAIQRSLHNTTMEYVE